ncbi:MAG: DUF692 domain-containing protein, partial [Spongiibacteraceae bacterium]
MQRAQADHRNDTASVKSTIGIGLRAPHYQSFLTARPPVDFVEVHSENFFGRDAAPAGGRPLQVLEQVRRDYALSLHGVGLSLGSAQAVDADHLRQLQQLVHRCQPLWVSEHLSWAGFGGVFANDLLPLPYTEEALAVVAENIQRVQEVLQRPLLIENPSRYLAFKHSTMDEPEFLAALTKITGCALLLDINNVYVSAVNLGFNAVDYLHAIDPVLVAEIHLAGFSDEKGLLLDTHGAPVAAPVWDLYDRYLSTTGPRPTLVEWDTQLPALPVLLSEAEKALKISL